MTCVLGIDGGGTHTRAVLVDAEGRVLGAATGASINPRHYNRDVLRSRLSEVIMTYSFTDEERAEAARNGLNMNPKTDPGAGDDALFDEAIAEIYHQQMELRRRDQAQRLV